MKRTLLTLTMCFLAGMCAASAQANGTWQIVGEIPGFVDPTGLTWDGTYLWAVEQHKGFTGVPLYKIDPGTMSIVETVNLNLTNCCVQGLAWDGRYIWICDVGYYIYRYDPVGHALQQTCARVSNPQPIGLVWYGGSLYGTGWQGSVPPEHIMSVNTSSCGYSMTFEITGVANCGLTFDGTDFLVSGRHQDWTASKSRIIKYSVDGDSLLEYEPFDFFAYDLAWDGAYLWVCDYGAQGVSDGRILKVALQDAPVSVEKSTWGAIKSMYRR